MRFEDDLVKDMLFQDDLFWTVVDSVGFDPVYSKVEQFVGELTFQLKHLDGSDRWKRSVTALVIRGERRLREMEDM